MKAVVVAIVLVILLAFGAYKVDTKPAVSSCGSVSGGSQWTSKGIEAVEGFGNWVHDLASKPSEDRRAAIEKAVDGVWRKVLLVWFKTLISSGRGKPLDPDVAKVKKQAEAERQAAEDRCTPCPPTAAEPPVGGVDPRVMLTASQATGTESEQIVRIAVALANQRELPDRAKLIIIEAGLVESGLRNLDYGDRDSVGWLQQRPSAGWGTVAQIMDPAYAAGKFYDALVRVDGWQSMSPGRAAQAVQISAFPDRYDEREEDARDWLERVGESPGEGTLADGVGPGCSVDPTVPSADNTTYETADFGAFQNRRSVAQAMEYLDRMTKQGTSIPSGRCLHYMALAYGWPGTVTKDGSHYAIEQWHLTPEKYRHPNDTTAPRGALLYWDTGSGRPGHIAISAGNGMVYSTDQPRSGAIGLVRFSTFAGYGDFEGWTPPFFYGQTKVMAAVAA